MRNLLPFLIRPCLLLPAERLLPGQMPAQLARCFALGNWLMSGPISARILAAVISLTPGMVAAVRTLSVGLHLRRNLCFDFFHLQIEQRRMLDALPDQPAMMVVQVIPQVRSVRECAS